MLAEIASQVAQGLATFEMHAGSAFISTPLLYPGGAPVVVRIDESGGRYVVTDGGIGQREAHMLGGDRIFSKLAPNVAARFGVSFDNYAFFAVDAARDELEHAVVAISNASRSAVEITAYRVAEKATVDARSLMQDRLLSLFGPRVQTKGVVARGASNDEWEFDAALQSNGRIVLFEAITPYAASVASAVTKFVDVSDRKDRPELVAVLADPAKTPHKRLIERSAMTIGISAEDDAWLRLAA
jgi:hypothetical protein